MVIIYITAKKEKSEIAVLFHYDIKDMVMLVLWQDLTIEDVVPWMEL